MTQRVRADPQDPEARAHAALRLAAAHVYVYGPQDIRPQDLCELAAFSHLPASTLSQWAAQDSWVRRRKEQQDTYRKSLHRQLGDMVLEQSHAHLEALDAISSEAKVMASMAKPKSWEAVQQVHLRCLELKHEWQRDMLERSNDQMPQEVTQHPLPKDSPFNSLSPDQWQDMARFFSTLHDKTLRQADPQVMELLAESSTDSDLPT